MTDKEETPEYVLSANGYCLNPKKLIEEFLKDWRWGRAYGKTIHLRGFRYPTCNMYWKWFEEKWEAKLK